MCVCDCMCKNVSKKINLNDSEGMYEQERKNDYGINVNVSLIEIINIKLNEWV